MEQKKQNHFLKVFEYNSQQKSIESDRKQIILNEFKNEKHLEEIFYKSRYQSFLRIISHFDDQNSKLIGNCLKFLKRLKGLEIEFEVNKLTNDHSIEIIANNFHHLKSLEILCMRIQLQTIQLKNLINSSISIGKHLKEIQNLKTLYLKYDNASQITKSGAESISAGLECLSNLKSLNYELSFNNQINDIEIFDGLCKGFSSPCNLIHLHLQLKKIGLFPIQFIESISQNIIKMQNLRYLDLELTMKRKEIKDEMIALKNTLLSLKNLILLKIHISEESSTGSDLVALFNGLLNHENLEELNISLSFYNQVPQCYKMGQNNNVNSKLTKLTLYFQSAFQGEDYSIEFDQSFQNLKNLTSLQLFVNLTIVDNGDQGFVKLLQNCQNLQELYLSDMQVRTKENGYCFGQCLSKLIQLKELSLQIIKDKQSIKLFDILYGISSLKNLESFNLSIQCLFESQKISLADSFKLLINLKQLSLSDAIDSNNIFPFYELKDSFSYLTKLTKLTIEVTNPKKLSYFNELSQTLKTAISLKEFSFYYIKYDLIILKIDELQSLCSGIRGLKNLNYLEIACNYSNSDSFDVCQQFRDTFKKLKCLQYIQPISYYFDYKQVQNYSKRINPRLVMFMC